MLALRHDLIKAGPDIASDSRCIKLEVELDALSDVAQPERVVTIELISGRPARTWWQTQYALLMECLHMKSPPEAGKHPVAQSLFTGSD